MRTLALSIVLAASASALGQSPTTRPVLRADLGAASPDGWAKALLDHSLIHPAPREGPGGGDAIRVEYVGNVEGSRRVIVSHPLPTPGPEMTLCFDVRFGADWQWVKGGKMHGLGPDKLVAGGNATQPDGWSARVMWARDGALQTYLYTQDKTNKYGDVRVAKDFRFETGRYYRVAIHVRVNGEAGASDAFTHVYVDGRPVIRHDGVRLRAQTGPGTLITTALFNTFFGGNDPSWSPVDADGKPKSVHAHYANLAVYAGRHVPGEAKAE